VTPVRLAHRSQVQKGLAQTDRSGRRGWRIRGRRLDGAVLRRFGGSGLSRIEGKIDHTHTVHAQRSQPKPMPILVHGAVHSFSLRDKPMPDRMRCKP